MDEMNINAAEQNETEQNLNDQNTTEQPQFGGRPPHGGFGGGRPPMGQPPQGFGAPEQTEETGSDDGTTEA